MNIPSTVTVFTNENQIPSKVIVVNKLRVISGRMVSYYDQHIGALTDGALTALVSSANDD